MNCIHLALKAVSHISLGTSPQDLKPPRKPALKARFNSTANDSRFQR
jgi:hypothetical protein